MSPVWATAVTTRGVSALCLPLPPPVPAAEVVAPDLWKWKKARTAAAMTTRTMSQISQPQLRRAGAGTVSARTVSVVTGGAGSVRTGAGRCAGAAGWDGAAARETAAAATVAAAAAAAAISACEGAVVAGRLEDEAGAEAAGAFEGGTAASDRTGVADGCGADGAEAGDGANEIVDFGLVAGAALSREGGSAGGVVDGGATVASFRISDVRLRGGVFVAGAPEGVTAVGFGARDLAATAAPAASSAAPVSAVVERPAVAADGAWASEEEAAARVAWFGASGAAGFVAAAGWAVSGGSGAVAGRFALPAEIFCEGRRPEAVVAAGADGALIDAAGACAGAVVRSTVAGRGGMAGACPEFAAEAAGCGGAPEVVVGAVAGPDEVGAAFGVAPLAGRLNAGTAGSGGNGGNGVICAVGASPERAGFLVAAAGRGGAAGVCAGEPGQAGEIDCEARLSEVPVTAAVGFFAPAGTCGSGGPCVPIDCWGGRGVSGM